MKVLITGITGFIGKSLSGQLPQGHEYFILARRLQGIPSSFKVILGDINDLSAVKEQIKNIKPDVCVHLAWEDLPDYGYEASAKNLKNGTALFHFLVKECACRKIISAGSCWEYGKNFGPCAETDAVSQGSYFVWAKRALCDLGLSLVREEKIDFIWLRLFFVYGPRQRSAALIPTLTQALKNNENPQLRTPLDANDFVHVDDVAQALVRSIVNEIPSGIYNVGSGISVPVWRVCALIEEALKMNTRYFESLKKASSSQKADFWADTKLSSRVLNWQAKKDLAVGIREYLKG
jgi:UDP-glucose 4-epimerase